MFQLARRIYGAKIAPSADHLLKMLVAIDEGKYDDLLQGLKGMREQELRKVYQEREMEPAVAGEDWEPRDTTGL
jgi:hypothetical protein